MAGVCLIKIRGEGVKVLRGGVLGGLQRPGWDGGAETPLQSLPTPGPASKCPLRGDDPWEAEPQAALRAQETGSDRTHLRHISPVSVMFHFGRLQHRRKRSQVLQSLLCPPSSAILPRTPSLSGSGPGPCSSVCTPHAVLVSLWGAAAPAQDPSKPRG